MTVALLAGGIDAFSSWDPWPIVALKDVPGAFQVIRGGDVISYLGFNVATAGLGRRERRDDRAVPGRAVRGRPVDARQPEQAAQVATRWIPGLDPAVAEEAMQYNIQQADRRLSAINYARPAHGGRHAASAGLHRRHVRRQRAHRTYPNRRARSTMDLGIRGRTAIVCGASRGLGRGSAEKLAEAGVDIVLNARSRPELEKAAEEIARVHGVKVVAIAADVTTPEGRDELLAACPAPDILVNNAGGPPPGMWHNWGEAEWQGAIRANMLSPIHLITAVLPGMIERKWGRIVNITSGSVKSPIPELGLSGAARCGLTGFVAAPRVRSRGMA
jgi:NADP-dependent 3-hydroxy acid dehydrogenase YdfG